jgi:hypothetical protein
MKFFADSSFVCPERSYRIGDLANGFPPKAIFTSNHDPNDRIIEILQAENMQLHLKQFETKAYEESFGK